jgi:prepilin-type processing-associated H-X9-DG protein
MSPPIQLPKRSGTAAPGMANYLAVCGKGLAFEGTKGRRIMDIRDGLSNTILVVEANDDRAAVWTKPDDWQYDAEHPMAGLGEAHPAGFNALFADGHVLSLAKDIDPKVFHAMLTIAGGEPIPPGL